MLVCSTVLTAVSHPPPPPLQTCAFAIVLHALVYRLPFDEAVHANGISLLLWWATQPALCSQGHAQCAAGSGAKQALAAALRRVLGTRVRAAARALGWRGVLAGAPAWRVDCTVLHCWWQACAFVLAMHLLYSRERRDRLAWAPRAAAGGGISAGTGSSDGVASVTATPTGADALADARKQMQGLARPLWRVLLEVAIAAALGWVLLDAAL